MTSSSPSRSALVLFLLSCLAYQHQYHAVSGLTFGIASTRQTTISNRSASVSVSSSALQASNNDISNSSSSSSSNDSRRSFLFQLPLAAATAAATTFTQSPAPASATLMDTNQKNAKTFKPGEKLTTEENKLRFKLAIQEIDELLTNYASISKDGNGDAVRRYLGTVGVSSYMYGITKVLKDLRMEVEDIVEFTEDSEEFAAYLYQAEGAAYQSLFVEHSSAKGSPESFLATARNDVVNMRKLMGKLATQLDIEV